MHNSRYARVSYTQSPVVMNEVSFVLWLSEIYYHCIRWEETVDETNDILISRFWMTKGTGE